MSYDYLNNLEHYIVSENKTHKHKRTKRVYEPEEYNIYHSYLDYEDYDGWVYYDDIIENDWYLDEIGLPHYMSDFDWENELMQSGYFEEDVLLFVNNITIKC